MAQETVGSPVPSTSASAALIDELRALFKRNEHEGLVSRADQLLKRKRLTDVAVRNIIEAARSASLIHLGRTTEAEPGLSLLHAQGSAAPGFSATGELVTFARYYLSWAHVEGAAEAAKAVHALPGEDARRLEAQLLYRSGSYSDSAAIYEKLLTKLKSSLAERKKPTTASRWSIASVTGRGKATHPPLTAAELENFSSSINELATNYTAALVLSGQNAKVDSVVAGLQPSYELEYNTACAKIHEKEFSGAEVSLEKAEALVRADLEEDEDDAEEAVAPIRVQKAYLRHLAGEVGSAEKLYTGIMNERKADAASLAVAANNLTVALGQLAFEKQESKANTVKATSLPGGSQSLKPTLPKEQHDALVEGLKKMRATSGKNVSRKLTLSQRQAMARNRAILLVQMGRYDACRAELTKLKSEFSTDSLVPLIEASMVARQGNLETADKILSTAGSNAAVSAARIQLTAADGKSVKAATLLQELFPGRPAALVTAAALLEEGGNFDEAVQVLTDLVASTPGPDYQRAKLALAETLLRNSRYKDAAQALREICEADPSNASARAQLVVATSYFDTTEAERVAAQLPSTFLGHADVDAQHLESLPPPKKKAVAVKKSEGGETESLRTTQDSASRALGEPRPKKKKKKKRLPKNYDPNGPPPDPERWLPKTLRSGYKKKKQKNDANRFKGSQGADAAAAEVAAAKNAERSAARAAASTSIPQPPGGRARTQKKKRNKR